MLTGTNLTHTKQYNLRIVLEVIRQFGPLSRADVARRTELTVQTVSNLVKDLVEHELIVDEAEQRREGRGAPSRPLAINPGGAWTLGLDLDRDHLTGVLVDLGGTVRQRKHIELDYPTPQQALELMTEVALGLIEGEGLKRERISGVGVGVPGPMRRAENGYVVSPRAFPGWENVPLASWLEERLELPILLENNATAAAVGERWYGAGQQIRTFFYVYFGSGLGGGLIMDGHPYEGFTGNAGEIGYLPTVLAGEPGADDLSHVGMHFNLRRLYEKLRTAGAHVHTPGDLDQLLVQGDRCLLQWLDDAADHLTGLVLAVEYLMDPQAIFFGGRLPDRVLAGLLERVAAKLPERRTVGEVERPRHLLARAGVDAAALGVATLPIYEVFAPALRLLLKPAKNQVAAGFDGSRVIMG